MKRTKWSCFPWDKYKHTIFKKKQIRCLFVIENGDGTAELYEDNNRYQTGHTKIFDIQVQEGWGHKFIKVVAVEGERYQQLKKVMLENRVRGLFRTVSDYPFEYALGDPVILET